MSQRTERVNELLRQEIGDILTRSVQDPHIGFATITRIETSPDLAHARVWVSIIGQPAERAETLAALARAMPYVRHELGARLRLRRIPVLHVELDDSIQRGTRVLAILHELETGGTTEPTMADEPLPTPNPALLRPEDVDGAPAAPAPGRAPGARGSRSHRSRRGSPPATRETGPRPRKSGKR